MIGDFFSWYVDSLAEFWGMAIRLRLPQILLLILLVCWLRRRGCGKSRGKSGGKSCCWTWTCGCDGDCWFCKPPESECGCSCGCCCCKAGGAREAAEAAEAAEEDGDA